MTLWLPWARRNEASVTGGSFVAGYARKLVVHTTETDVFRPGASYYGATNWPHATITRDGTVWQHIDMDLAARALVNARGGAETNRGGAVQVEVVGRSGNGDDLATGEQIAALRRMVKDLRDLRGLVMRTLPAGAIPNSARVGAPQRMSATEWRTFSGICGHRHVPENTHWDPGAFDLARLLPTQEDDMADRTLILQGPDEQIWVCSLLTLTRRYVGDPKALSAIEAMFGVTVRLATTAEIEVFRVAA